MGNYALRKYLANRIVSQAKHKILKRGIDFLKEANTWKIIISAIPLMCSFVGATTIMRPESVLCASFRLPASALSDDGSIPQDNASLNETDHLIDRVAYPTPDYIEAYGIGTSLAPRLGLNAQDGNNLGQVAAAGFTWVRFGTRWDNIEVTQQGSYNNWSTIDYYALDAAANNLKPLWTLCCGNTLYATGDNPNGYPITPQTLAGFVGYAQALVGHLGPGQYYEVYNEPESPQTGPLTPAEYATLANTVISAIKAIDPTAKVTTTGPGGWLDSGYLNSMFAAGFPAAGVVPDGIGTHAYIYPYLDTQPPHDDGDPELLFTPDYPAQENTPPYHAGYVNTWSDWEAVKAQYNVWVATWDTESGTNLYNLPNFATDPLAQARQLVRRILVEWAAGFPLQFLFDKDGMSFTEDYCFSCNPNNVQAITTLTTLVKGYTLTGFTLDKALYGTSNLNFFKLDNPTSSIYIMWVRSGSLSQGGIPFGTQGYDMLGNSFTTNGSVVLSAANGPIYLLVNK